MIKRDINQSDNLNSELLNLIEFKYKFSNKPIKRITTKPTLENLRSKLQDLKEKIENSDIHELKNNQKKIIFDDGNISSPIMIIGDNPTQEDSKLGKPFLDDSGKLLDKMLNAITLNRDSVYITNLIKYAVPEGIKIEQSEMNKHSDFLKKHISIIDPKILVLMGVKAMNAILGNKLKITEERGKWKEVIIGEKNYKIITTFHPAYLLRKPEKKKFSWEDLKKIKKKIIELNINI